MNAALRVLAVRYLEDSPSVGTMVGTQPGFRVQRRLPQKGVSKDGVSNSSSLGLIRVVPSPLWQMSL